MSRLKSPVETGEHKALDLDEIKDFYDSVYHAEATANQGDGLARHYAGLFDRLGLTSEQVILDVACGSGGWLQFCHERGLRVSGVDLSDKAIAVCKQNMPQGIFYAQPAETLPHEDSHFDVVTCLGSLEHFVDPVGSLREMARVSKSGAEIILLVPNKDFLSRKLGLFAGTYQVDAKEVVRTLDEWESLFEQAEIEVLERWRDLHVLNMAWVTTGKWYMWPLRALQAACLPLWPLKWQYQVYHRCVVR
jgi:ubiquinone/menaquinone biosynthesis C-methylase UbiE